MGDKGQKTMIRDRVCRSCGVSFPGGPNAQYCPICRAERAKEAHRRYRKNGAARKLGSTDLCARCGAKYTVDGSQQKYCPACIKSGEPKKAYNKAWYKTYYEDEENREKVAAQKKDYYEAHREEKAARNKAYREENREELAAYSKAYYEANREKAAAYQKAYREAHREEIAARDKAYREANKDKVAARDKAYREAKKKEKNARG